MARSLLKRIGSLFSKGSADQNEQPAPVFAPAETGRKIIPESEHQIPRKYLDDNAMKVVYRLIDGGYDGYLVGGCIRDLLQGEKPKDFDVATSASPEEAHELFRRSRLIGRRFKLLHVRFGREIIEVATFRASHDSHPENSNGEHGRQNESGMITRDNVYGTIEEDADRRDFTVNALYYCVKDHSIYDFANGYQDLKDGVLRMIGDPVARYREDPVRMLRAARFAGKLDFEIEANTAAPIRELAPLLKDIAPARLFDESLKLLQSGYAEGAYKHLQHYDLFEPLFPQTQRALLGERGELVETLLLNALRNTDRRLAQRKSVTPAFLFAALLWYPVQDLMQKLMKENRMPPLPALHEAANQVLAKQVKSTAIPRRFSTPIREIWEMQIRLPRRDGKRAERLIEQPRFRAAYDLLLLRENSGEDLGGLSRWWTEYQSAHPEKREQMSRDSGKGQKPRRRRRKKPNNATRDE
ncbi:polynucleotide adenylyltransferase PcnB [Pontibacterium granulatum]|uniref:polynucleotide adenylyltransferase PcnB n=1 Tax=Pontibacterium granulatum TaxID=2036029 RepID=UPI002499D070|nr:polynucleotide adenylyltransferase PcnB [Pontibacterium granulatum]MDI3325908.1 polynucleotide adenylyltransferase PcnB [Pontibacterium granulatum]